MGLGFKHSSPSKAGIHVECLKDPQVTVASLSLFSDSLPSSPITLELSDPATLKKPVTIKEGAEFSVEIKFKVEGGVVSGLQYLQVVKRSGIKVDKVGPRLAPSPWVRCSLMAGESRKKP